MLGDGRSWQSWLRIPARPCTQGIARLEYGLVESVALALLCYCSIHLEWDNFRKHKYMGVHPRSSASYPMTLVWLLPVYVTARCLNPPSMMLQVYQTFINGG